MTHDLYILGLGLLVMLGIVIIVGGAFILMAAAMKKWDL